MVAGDPECYPVMFVYTPDGFPHQTDHLDGLGRYSVFLVLLIQMQSNITVLTSPWNPVRLKKNMTIFNQMFF